MLEYREFFVSLFAMRPPFVRSLLVFCLCFCAVAPAFSQEEGGNTRTDVKSSQRRAKQDLRRSGQKLTPEQIAVAEKKAAEEAVEEEYKRGRGFDYTKEFKALDEAAALLAEVNDEKAAKDAAKKISILFSPLPIPLSGSDAELERWARQQNKVNRQMERLRQMPFWGESGLQEAWTLVTDPFSRRRAQKTK